MEVGETFGCLDGNAVTSFALVLDKYLILLKDESVNCVHVDTKRNELCVFFA